MGWKGEMGDSETSQEVARMVQCEVLEPELGQEAWPGMKLEHVAEAALGHPEAEWRRRGLRSKATSYREGSRTFTGQVGWRVGRPQWWAQVRAA